MAATPSRVTRAITLAALPYLVASLCWPEKPPSCAAPVSDGRPLCAEGAVLLAGENCTAQCDPAGLLVVYGFCNITCPPCDDAASEEFWIPTCGPAGTSCNGSLQLGTMETEALGLFSCIERSKAVEFCEADMMKMEAAAAAAVDAGAVPPDPHTAEIQGYLGFLGALAGLAVLGTLAVRIPSRAVQSLLFTSSSMTLRWNLANLIMAVGFLTGAALLALLFVTRDPLTDAPIFLVDNSVAWTGLAAAAAAFSTIAWSFYRGLHGPLKVTRQAAWKLHIFFGVTFLGFATVHPILAYADGFTITDGPAVGDPNTIGSFQIWQYKVGLVALLLLWAGVLGAPSLARYDSWKLLHYLSLVGYMLSILHFYTVAWVSIPSVILLGLYLLQKWYVTLQARLRAVEVLSAEILAEDCGKHLVLTLHVPGFEYRPGQWCRIHAPGNVSSVAHPFTIVPSGERWQVRFFIKVTGNFTQRLAIYTKSPGCRLRLEGPYGEPAVPNILNIPTVFVLGGVGVTPALSLAAEAKRTTGVKPPVFWSLRCKKLLDRCAPMLEDVIDMQHSQVLVPTSRAEILELNARSHGDNIATWMANVASYFRSIGHTHVQLFVCGPPGLAADAEAATRKEANSISWDVHVEQFRFLPEIQCSCAPRAPTPPPRAPSMQPEEIEKGIVVGMSSSWESEIDVVLEPEHDDKAGARAVSWTEPSWIFACLSMPFCGR